MPILRLLIYLLTLYCTAGFGQDVIIKGAVADSSNVPLEAATVYITKIKDSSVVDYTISDKNGKWELKIPKITEPIHLKVSFVGMLDYKQELSSLTADRDFNTIRLIEQPMMLDAVTVQGEVPPIRIKKDTLEFNASSFKVRPDANVEALLKKLPGITIDNDGKISHNGKEVGQILVNGKPFFGADGSVALQNLPADIIDKVQVTDQKTRKEEMTGQQASSDNASINLTIKKDKNKGTFGTVTGGYGTDDRYEAGVFANHFKDKRRISITASSNNINASGFAMNDIYGSMGGRGMGVRSSMAGRGLGGGSGITISNTAGINYTDEWFQDFESTASYNYNGSDSENKNRNEIINYQPEIDDPENPGSTIDPSYLTNSNSRTQSTRESHNINTDFRLKIDSTSSVTFAPKFTLSKNSSFSSSNRFSQRLSDSRLLNESTSGNSGTNDDRSFTGSLNYYKRFPSKKGRGLNISFSNSNNNDDGESRNRSTTVSYEYEDGIPTEVIDDRNQVLNNTSSTDNYNGSLEYFEPLTDSLRISISAGYTHDKTTNDRKSFDYDPATGRYTIFNDALSDQLESQTSSITPRAGIAMNKKKLNLDAYAGARFSSFDNNSLYMGQAYAFRKDYILPSASLNARYSIEKGKSLSFNYSYSSEFPQARQVLPVADISNPLNTVIGNPDLDPTRFHSLRIMSHNFSTARKSGFFFFGTVSIYDSQVVAYTLTDESAKNTTTYKNISGAMQSALSLNWNRDFQKESHLFRLNMGIISNYGINKAYLNGELYNAKSLNISPSAGLTYEYGELLTVSPQYNFNYNTYNYTNYSVSSSSAFTQRASLEVTSYWPKNLVFGNDIGYTFNSNIAPGFRKDFYMWNTSLGYNFIEDTLLLRIKVYDVLNQNTGTSRTIGATTITDQDNMVLKRYVMFSLTYKLKKFGSKEKN